MRSSMPLRLSASRSSSSPVPPTGSRPDRSPAMMVCAVCVIASTRLSTRRLTKMPPAMPRMITIATDQRPAVATMSNRRSRSSRSRPTSRRKPPGKQEHPRQRVMLGRFPVPRAGDRPFRSSPACRACPAPANRYCRRAPRRSATSRDRGSIPAGANAARSMKTSRRMPPWLYCSASPPISASTVEVICSVISRRVLSAK